MELYNFLFLNGRVDFEKLEEWYGKDIPDEEIFKLKEEGKISLHREKLGKLWIRCPAYERDGIEELVEKNPGISVGELRTKMRMSQRAFNALLEEAQVEKRKDGRMVLLYPLDGTHSQDEESEDRQRRLEESERYTRAVREVEQRIAERDDAKVLSGILAQVWNQNEEEAIDFSQFKKRKEAAVVRTFLRDAGLIEKRDDEWWFVEEVA